MDEFGKMQIAKGFHCRKCDENFSSVTACEAPVYQNRSVVERRQKELAQERVGKALEDAFARGGKEAVHEERMKMVRKLFEGKVNGPVKDPRIPE
jgi:hypothetical protein